MDRLTADELRSRLSFDYQTVTLMSCPLMEVEAYRNEDDLRAQRNKITSPEEGHLAVYYRVKYNLKTLVARGRYSNSTTVQFDLFADNDYPQSEPACSVMMPESELPWSPHFHPLFPICIGPIWKQSDGNMLLGELMVHVAKLLNFDEPPNPTIEHGYQPDAARYWVNELGRQPISKLVYPTLPVQIHRVDSAESAPAPSVFVKKGIVGSEVPASASAISLRMVTSAVTETPAAAESPRIKFR